MLGSQQEGEGEVKDKVTDNSTCLLNDTSGATLTYTIDTAPYRTQ